MRQEGDSPASALGGTATRAVVWQQQCTQSSQLICLSIMAVGGAVQTVKQAMSGVSGLGVEGRRVERRRQRPGRQLGSALDAPSRLRRTHASPLPPAEQTQTPALSCAMSPLPGAGRPVAWLPPAAAPASHLQCDFLPWVTPHPRPSQLVQAGSKTVPGVLQKPLEEVGPLCQWAGRHVHGRTCSSAAAAPCAPYALPRHRLHHILLLFLCAPLNLQVAGEYNRVCEGCVNADTSAKTFVRAVGED